MARAMLHGLDRARHRALLAGNQQDLSLDLLEVANHRVEHPHALVLVFGQRVQNVVDLRRVPVS